MSAHTTEKLVYMANQIARNVTHEPDPVAMIADHIHAFWSARMKADIFAVLKEAALEPAARAALERLAAHAG
jgi:formate dehydrogenase subunit delta